MNNSVDAKNNLSYSVQTNTTRCKTASESTRARSLKINKEIHKANRKRIVKEVERAKILVDDIRLDRPKPATFYIEKAREKFLGKGKEKKDTEDRDKVFGPMLSARIIKDSQRAKTAEIMNRSRIEKLKELALNNSVVPEWLMERSDYQATVKKMMSSDGNLLEICATPVVSRTEEEKECLIKWISSIGFFQKLPPKATKDLSDKLLIQYFKKNEQILNAGEHVDFLLIILSGKANIYLNSTTKTVQSKGIIGEHIFTSLKAHSTTVTALEPITALKLFKIDYDAVLFSMKKDEKYKNSKLLMSIPFFRNWSHIKVQHISNYLTTRVFNPGEVIYEKNEESDTFYIIKSGQVDVQAYVELQHINRWPIGGKQWKVLEINRRYIVNIATLKRGSYFGESTLIEQMPRVCRTIAAVKSVCLTLEKDDFFDIFSVKDLENLQECTYIKIPTEEELQNQVISEMQAKMSTEQAIYDSMGLDFKHPDARESLLDNKTKRLRGWIFNLKERLKKTDKDFKKRIVFQEKKNIELDSLVMLNMYCDDLKKSKYSKKAFDYDKQANKSS